jgi:DNA-binding NarL/FixJ family response regulator
MPATQGRHGEEGRPLGEPVGLVADECPLGLLAELGAILEHEGFAPTVLDGEGEGEDVEVRAQPVAIVLTLADPASGAASAVGALAERFAGTPVVLVCPSPERRQLRAALTAGVAGMVGERELDRALGPCMRAVLAGQLCIPRSHWREVEPPVLSARERQVLGLVAMGYMNRQIAERLYLAESTVKSHLSSVYGKLGVSSRSEAAEVVREHERGFDAQALGLVDQFAGGAGGGGQPAPAS